MGGSVGDGRAGAEAGAIKRHYRRIFNSHMQTGCPSSSQFLTVGDEGLKAFNMSVLGDASDYLWKEFQGSVRVSCVVLWGFDRIEKYSGSCVDLLSQV